MHTPPLILVVDDQPQNVQILKDRLEGEGYEILMATAGEQALVMATDEQPDLILLDVIMPGMDGIEVCRRLKENVALPLIPVIMVTAKSEEQDIMIGFEAGADEYLTKPLDQSALIARVKSMLRLKSFHDIAWDQATQLESQAAELEDWNETLESQLQSQTTDLERISRLKQFLSPQLAEWVVSSDDAEPLVSERREVTILCCALRKFTTFVDTTEPEIALDVLKDYQKSIEPLVTRFGGYLERLGGDKFLVLFNALLPCSDPILRAVGMAIEIREQLDKFADEWQLRGYELDFGIGIAHGDVTLGMIDRGGQCDYAVIGSPRHLALRLCEKAKGGHILVSQAVSKAASTRFHTEFAGELFQEECLYPIPTFEVNRIGGLN